MSLQKTHAALAALKEILVSREGSKALAAYDAEIQRLTMSSGSSALVNQSVIPDSVLQALLNRLELTAESLRAQLAKEDEYIDQLIVCAGFCAQMHFWFRQMRSLNGGELASLELCELEAEALALLPPNKAS
ncbi:hypothetical protein BH11CYA1_BH11CYA1_12170 [soil metagenome]